MAQRREDRQVNAERVPKVIADEVGRRDIPTQAAFDTQRLTLQATPKSIH